MDERDFTSTISGEVRSNYGQYVYFQPNPLPFKIDMNRNLLKKATNAIILLSRLDGRSSEMGESEKEVFMKAFTLKESTHSSSIEGTRSTLSDMYMFEKMKPENENRLRDSREIINYKDALKMGLSRINEGGNIDRDLLLDMHGILLNNVRGENRSPGKFKTEQNAIGRFGGTLDTAKFVPAPPESVDYLLDNLFEYMESDEDPIIKTALIHYQFESIHPFRDGNGRIGRLMILLMLAKEGILHSPLIYPSEYFDNRREEYIDRMYNVSSKDEFDEWFEFFMDALINQTKSSLETIDELRSYRAELKSKCSNMTELQTVELLFSNPFINSSDVMEHCRISNPTAIKTLFSLEGKGIIRETTGKKRNMLYAADGILEILSRRR